MFWRSSGQQYSSAILLLAGALGLLVIPAPCYGAPQLASAKDPASAAPILDSSERARIQQSYGALPVSFEPNLGQTDPQVKFLSRRHGYTLFLTSSQAVMAFRANSPSVSAKPGQKTVPQPAASIASLRMRLLGAKSEPESVGDGELPGKSNYFIGNDPSKWRSNIPHFSRVAYREVYPGVDLVFHDSRQELEFDFVVAPRAKAGKIALRFEGASQMRVDAAGDLVLATEAGDIHLHKPVAYQEEAGARHPVDANFAIRKNGEVAFELGAYDGRRPLVIDPSLLFSTYLGGSGEDEAEAIVAFGGDVYVAGKTNSVNFPLSAAEQGTPGGGFDVFVTELTELGDGLVFSTYLGGSQDDEATAISTGGLDGGVWVAGVTASPDFPVTTGAIQSKFGGGASDAFVVNLFSNGTLSYSTYLGGSGDDGATSIIACADYTICVAGWTFSTDFPTSNPFQSANHGGEDGFITEIGYPNVSTYLGGSQNDRINALVLGPNGITVIGSTASPDFPVTAGAFQPKCGSDGNCNGGLDDAFVTEISLQLNPPSALISSTFLGGSGADEGTGIALDESGNVWVVGQTLSPDFPVTPGAFQTKCGTDGNCNGGQHDVFLTSLNLPYTGPSTVTYSTFLGGGGDDVGTGIVFDSFGNIYVTGRTESTDFPTGPALQPPFQAANAGGADAFITAFKPIGSGGPPLLYSSYLGGSGTENSLAGSTANAAIGAIAFDTSSATFGEPPPPATIYLAGGTNSTDFSIVSPVAGEQAYQGGPSDAFVTAVSAVLPLEGLALTTTSNIACIAGPCAPAYITPTQAIWSYNTGTSGDDQTLLYYAGTQVTLSAKVPLFWGGACSGYVSTCNLTVTAPLTVSALFGPFSLSINPATATLQPGQSSTSTITVSALNGYSGAEVSLTCSLYDWPGFYPGTYLGPPADSPTCTISPAVVNLVTGGSATATVTVYTTAPSSASNIPDLRRELRWACGFFLPVTGLLLSGFVFATDRRLKKNFLRVLAGVILAALALSAACGGGSKGKSGGGGVPGTESGGYFLAINGSVPDGNTNQAILTVNVP